MKKFISIISAVLAASVILSLAGCKKQALQPEPTTAVQIAEIRLGYVDCEPDDDRLAQWLSDEYKYTSVIADSFGLGQEGAKKFFESAYFVYGVTVEIVNNTDTAINVTGIESGTNGNNSVYIRNDFSGGEIGVEAHSSTPATLQVICANEDATDQEVIAELKAMVFNLKYTQGGAEKNFALQLENGVEVHKEPVASDEKILFGSDGILFDEKLWEKYKDDKPENRTALKTGFDVSDDFVNQFYKKSENYNFFNYPVRIQNMSGQDVVILGIETANDGADGIYVNVMFSGEMGVPAYDPNADYPLPTFAVQVLCDNDDLTDEEVQSVVDAMEFTVTYSGKTADGEADYNTKQTINVTIG